MSDSSSEQLWASVEAAQQKELRPRRELYEIKGDNWGPWVHGIFPVEEGGWFKRDHEALQALKTRCGGVYEIGLWPSSTTAPDAPIPQVYIGRATKVRKDVKGVTLRKRVYSGYALNGSHLANLLRVYLELGQHVFFRWKVLDTVHACIEAEAKYLSMYDYAFNQVGNTPCRDAWYPACVDPQYVNVSHVPIKQHAEAVLHQQKLKEDTKKEATERNALILKMQHEWREDKKKQQDRKSEPLSPRQPEREDHAEPPKVTALLAAQIAEKLSLSEILNLISDLAILCKNKACT